MQTIHINGNDIVVNSVDYVSPIEERKDALGKIKVACFSIILKSGKEFEYKIYIDENVTNKGIYEKIYYTRNEEDEAMESIRQKRKYILDTIHIS